MPRKAMLVTAKIGSLHCNLSGTLLWPWKRNSKSLDYMCQISLNVLLLALILCSSCLTDLPYLLIYQCWSSKATIQDERNSTFLGESPYVVCACVHTPRQLPVYPCLDGIVHLHTEKGSDMLKAASVDNKSLSETQK